MPVDSETPFRILILGDFSGRQNRNESLSSRLRAWRVDRDNFDDLFAKFDARLQNLHIVPDTPPLTLKFQDLESFEPDYLVEHLSIFASLRDVRDRLLDSNSFQAAAEEVLSWGHPSATAQSKQAPEKVEEAPRDPAAQIDNGNLLDQILDPEAAPAVEQKSEWQRMIDDIVSPYLVPGADPRQAELLACVDRATQATMNAILHHPDFVRLESAWRLLQMAVRRVETSPDLTIHVADISKEEFTSDLMQSAELQNSALHRLLVEETVETPGAEPWAAIIGNYEFGSSDDDLEPLNRISGIAAACGAPFICAADSTLVGSSGPCDDLSLDIDALAENSAWQKLRANPNAGYLGLTWPKFLVRLPYGAATRPIDAFEFEELPSKNSHRDLLWGNSAFLAAQLLGRAFSESDWSMEPGDFLEIDRLPVWTYEEDGESHLHPCGEYLLTERRIEALQSAGFMPIVSIRDADSIRLGGFYSVKSKRLAGPWD